jgi:hypothetical protein
MKQIRSDGRPQALFICGNARGGTTFLVRLLDGHPDLFVLPTETQIYPALATRPLARWLLRLAELGGWRSSVRLLAHPALARIGFRGPDALADRLRRWVREYPAGESLADAEIVAAATRARGPHEYWLPFLDLFSRFTGTTVAGKHYWVEKTPQAERFAAVSDAWCGHTCRFLHVVRDPRDFIASYLLREARLRGVEHRDRAIVRLCFVWAQSVMWCQHGMRTIAGRYHALRYEDLVHAPERTMAAVCACIGIPMNHRLLIPTSMAEPVRHNSSDMAAEGGPGEIIHAPLGRFSESLTARETAGIERLLGALMEACGYPRVQASLEQSGSLTEGSDWRTRLLAWKSFRSRLTDRSALPFVGA